jgi:phosphoglycolate phosphatase
MEILHRPPVPTPDETPLRYKGDPLRLIAIDIDGTITDMARRLEWPAVIALRAAEAAGIPVVLATGNVIPVTKTFYHSIGLTGPMVCENGGVLYWEMPDPATGRIRITRKVLHGREDADKVVQELERQGFEPRRISSDPWRESEAAIENDSVPEKDVEAAVKKLGFDHLYVVTTGFACHILHKGTDKYEGLKKIVDWLNEHDPRFNPDHSYAKDPTVPLRMDEVLAIGDSPNDLQMLQHAKVGAAVADAPDHIKEKADIVTNRPHGAGVHELLSQLGLKIPPYHHL